VSHPTATEDLLMLYAMGELDEAETALVRRQLATGVLDPAELAEWQALVGDLSDAVSEPARVVPAFTAVRDTTRSHSGVEVHVEQVARLVDAEPRRARRLLRLISDPAAWLDMYPGCRLMHLQPGPAVARPGLDVGFVSLEANTPFPEHRHLGDEAVLVLQGTLVDLTSGAVHSAGALVQMPAGTQHGIQAGPHEQLLYLVVVGGVEIPGVVLEEPPPELIW